MARVIPYTEAKGEEDIIQPLLKHVQRLHGLPLVHPTDQHGNFTGESTKKHFKAQKRRMIVLLSSGATAENGRTSYTTPNTYSYSFAQYRRQ